MLDRVLNSSRPQFQTRLRLLLLLYLLSIILVLRLYLGSSGGSSSPSMTLPLASPPQPPLFSFTCPLIKVCTPLFLVPELHIHFIMQLSSYFSCLCYVCHERCAFGFKAAYCSSPQTQTAPSGETCSEVWRSQWTPRSHSGATSPAASEVGDSYMLVSGRSANGSFTLLLHWIIKVCTLCLVTLELTN